MSWNYRIVKYKDGSGYGLHEVFYDDNGVPSGMTKNPAGFVSSEYEGPAGIHESMMMARTDAIRRPVLEEPDWLGTPPTPQEGE